MTDVPVYLAISRPAASQRAHFAIFVPDFASRHLDPSREGKGLLIHVVGAPMVGFQHEIAKGHSCAEAKRECVKLGEVNCGGGGGGGEEERVAGGEEEEEELLLLLLERIALGIRPPGISGNFLGPVDGVKNRRCQEWTMDFLRVLVEKGILGTEALEIAQERRDSPTHGIGLRRVPR
ncbi:Hypothetical predicted protein [Lecanosticta acicola]|uniref:Uncharacterized protein n=1 Tax=Lecanosticta acicola TaxID=111012 RepID=A0AAI9EFS0_9PEZI|nr:Hypothetical predicted protein [Lecanosticta acicola]